MSMSVWSRSPRSRSSSKRSRSPRSAKRCRSSLIARPIVVRDMPTTKGGTALDVLRNLPSVDVDIDNNVSLRGNPGVVIQINGRPSALKAAQLGNFLAQLPADAVDHVEIIPNPSARDDADGVAGIINIVLRQKPDAGTSGGVTVGAGTTGHVDTGINGGWQRGPALGYGSYSLLRDNSPRYDAIFRQDLFDDAAHLPAGERDAHADPARPHGHRHRDAISRATTTSSPPTACTASAASGRRTASCTTRSIRRWLLPISPTGTPATSITRAAPRPR